MLLKDLTMVSYANIKMMIQHCYNAHISLQLRKYALEEDIWHIE